MSNSKEFDKYVLAICFGRKDMLRSAKIVNEGSKK